MAFSKEFLDIHHIDRQAVLFTHGLLNEHKNIFAEARSKEEYILESESGEFLGGYNKKYSVLAKTIGAAKAMFTKSRHDLKDLRVYELDEITNLSGERQDVFREVYPAPFGRENGALIGLELARDIYATSERF